MATTKLLPLVPPASPPAPPLSQDKGSHLWLRALRLTRRKRPKQKPAGTHEDIELVLSPGSTSEELTTHYIYILSHSLYTHTHTHTCTEMHPRAVIKLLKTNAVNLMQLPDVFSVTEPAPGLSLWSSWSWRIKCLFRMDNEWGFEYFRTYTGGATTFFSAVSDEVIGQGGKGQELISGR